MSLNLEKGQKADITKGTGIKNIFAGLGWDINNTSTEPKFDLDAMLFCLNAAGKCASPEDVVYWGMAKTNDKLLHKSGAILHTGDNLTGAGDGDDEVIKIDLSKVPAGIERLAIEVTIYQAAQRHQNFGMVKNAFARVVNDGNNKEIMKLDLTEDQSINTSVHVGDIYRKDGEWKFDAIKTGSKEELPDLLKKYGVN